MHRLYREFAHRYDLHTPPAHYQHDQAFVIDTALGVKSENCRLLDLGCGTGVFLERAINAGIDAYGIDSAPEMIAVAQRRVGPERARVERMQELAEEDAYDLVVALSWPIHYCDTLDELRDVIFRCRRALRRGGLLVLQVANDERMEGTVNIDREAGPNGEPDDTVFIHRFLPLRDAEHGVTAEYVYASRGHREILCEQHSLRFANPPFVSRILAAAGFQKIRMTEPESVSPFLIATD